MTSLLDKDPDHIDIDDDKDYFVELVGDGKKFKTEKDLAKGKYLADQQIEIMKRRMDEMREDFTKAQDELKTRASIEEMMDKMLSRDNRSEGRENNQNANREESLVLDENKLASLFDQRLTHYERQKKAEANRAEVESKLLERYGANYKTALAKQINELGLSAEDMDAMAQRSPKAFFKTFGLDRDPNADNFEAPLRTTVKHGFAPDTGEKRTWSYYKKLRQKDPQSYFSAKIHNQMLKDMEVLGKDFEDGDFNMYK